MLVTEARYLYRHAYLALAEVVERQATLGPRVLALRQLPRLRVVLRLLGDVTQVTKEQRRLLLSQPLTDDRLSLLQDTRDVST